MYTQESLLHKVNLLFEDALGEPAPAPDTDLFASGLMDSLEFAGLLLSIEAEFGFDLTFESMDMDAFHSLAGIVRFVAAHTRLSPMAVACLAAPERALVSHA
ncbi:MAG TPA: acyl carrier protein [Gammaproteobacteria bacterium]